MEASRNIARKEVTAAVEQIDEVAKFATKSHSEWEAAHEATNRFTADKVLTLTLNLILNLILTLTLIGRQGAGVA